MDVRVQVDLSVAPAEKHLAEMHSARIHSPTIGNLSVCLSQQKPKSMIAAFTIPNARQMDVVDKIMRRFALFMEDYQDQTAWFPKKPRKKNTQRSQQVNAG